MKLWTPKKIHKAIVLLLRQKISVCRTKNVKNSGKCIDTQVVAGLHQTHLNVFKLVILWKMTAPSVQVCLISNSSRTTKSSLTFIQNVKHWYWKLHIHLHLKPTLSPSDQPQKQLQIALNILTRLDCLPNHDCGRNAQNAQEQLSFSFCFIKLN